MRKQFREVYLLIDPSKGKGWKPRTIPVDEFLRFPFTFQSGPYRKLCQEAIDEALLPPSRKKRRLNPLEELTPLIGKIHCLKFPPDMFLLEMMKSKKLKKKLKA